MDEEYGAITLVHDGGELDVPYRAVSYLLVTLGRERLRDAADGALAEVEHGWIHQDDLATTLGIYRMTLNVYVMRARKQLAALGVRNAATLIERRSGTGMLRIGVGRLEVRSR